MNAISTMPIGMPALVTRGVATDRSIAVLGLGYVGLPTALAYCETGHHVIGIDVSEERLQRIRNRDVDLVPADRARLDDVLGRPDFVLTADVSALEEADVVVICVPTPIDEHLLPDLSLLRRACEQALRSLRPGQLIMLTSTTYAGTTRDMLIEPVSAMGFEVGRDINIAFSPERINPGVPAHAQSDVPRVVGGATPACTERAVAVLSRITREVHAVSTPEAAELSKLYENTFRAVNIAFANEFAGVCRELGADVMEVLDAAATKPYGFMRFNPGPGVGGHCIPCDPHYLMWQLRRHRVTMPIVESAMNEIARRPLEVVDRVHDLLAKRGVPLNGARVLIVGVAYKPDVEDVRESPAIEIVSRLADLGAAITITDPHVPAMRLNDGVTLLCRRLTEVDIADFDIVVMHTRHAADDISVLSTARQVLDASYSLPRSDASVAL